LKFYSRESCLGAVFDCEDDDWGFIAAFPHVAEERKSIHSGQPDIKDNAIVLCSAKAFTPLFGVTDGMDRDVVSQAFADGPGNMGVVIDDQDGGFARFHTVD
jgi:hypothetical protein